MVQSAEADLFCVNTGHPLNNLHPHPLSVELYGEPQLDMDLVKSVEAVGILNPIIANDLGEILSGNRRYKAYRHLLGQRKVSQHLVIRLMANAFPPTDEENLEFERIVIEDNRQRIKTESQKDAEAAALLRIEKKLAAERQKAGVRLNSAEGGKAVEKVAAATGESADTVRKRAEIHAAGVDSAERDQQTTNSAYTEISNRKKRRNAFVQQYPDFADKPNKEVDAEINRCGFILPRGDATSDTTPKRNRAEEEAEFRQYLKEARHFGEVTDKTEKLIEYGKGLASNRVGGMALTRLRDKASSIKVRSSIQSSPAYTNHCYNLTIRGLAEKEILPILRFQEQQRFKSAEAMSPVMPPCLPMDRARTVEDVKRAVANMVPTSASAETA
jgi:hypothetical protein